MQPPHLRIDKYGAATTRETDNQCALTATVTMTKRHIKHDQEIQHHAEKEDNFHMTVSEIIIGLCVHLTRCVRGSLHVCCSNNL
ncbi:beta-1,3-galactosyltransferase 1 isoform X2 [Aquarana catesbeiana]|uniref:beta-1,3-galactosyltransferase 1 isoform X2 n=1 Tax=Aquarana catesbeiana TaxID=8400 RepID=UPI003CC9CCF1